MPFEGGCDAQICLNEGFTLSDFCWNSTVHELCTNGLFSAYWGWLLSESRFPDLLETLVVKVIERVSGGESGALQAGQQN